MALLFKEIKDGIQLGAEGDVCRACEEKAKRKRETVQQGLLKNKEVFLINISGLRHCYCMDCYKDLLGDYTLVKQEEINKNTKKETSKDNNESEKKEINNETSKAAKSSKRK